MTIRSKLRLAMLAVAGIVGTAQAQIIGPSRPSVPLACSLGDLSPLEQRVVDATAYLVQKAVVSYDAVSNTYSIPTSAYTDVTVWNPDTSSYHVWNLCTNSQFYNSKVVGDTMWGWARGRSATMIGHNLFVTAAHSTSFTAGNFYLVFMPSGFPCTISDLSSIPADNVYEPTASEGNLSASHLGYDFHYFYVDRSVVGRKPLKIRRSGVAETGNSVIQTGHSFWSGVRISRYGTYYGEKLTAHVGTPTAVPEPLLSDLYPYTGASGGPVFNMDDEVVETVVSRDIDGDSDFSGSCFIETFRDTAEPSATTNASVQPVASSIPRQEVRVEPLDRVVHIAAIGGTLAQPITNYQLQGGVSSTQYAVDPDPSMPASGAPTLVSSIPPGDRVMSFITPTAWTLTADISGVSSCGIWDYTYNVRDRYNLQNNYVRHHFEIGVKEIELSPSNGEDITDFGFPVGKTYTYTIQNVRPSTTTLDLKAVTTSTGLASSWLRIDGVTSKSVTLQPQGTIGDSISVILSVVEPMLGGATFPDSSFRIEHADPTCALTSAPNLVLPFSLTIGRDRFSAIASGDDVSGPTGGASYGTPQVTTVTVSEPAGYCVSDINARIGLLDRLSVNTAFPDAAESIRVRLKSPLGTQVTLWDKQAVPGSGYVESVDVAAYGQVFSSAYLVLDDESTPPLSGALSTFDGEPVEGNWEVEVAVGASVVVIPIQHVLDISVTVCKS